MNTPDRIDTVFMMFVEVLGHVRVEDGFTGLPALVEEYKQLAGPSLPKHFGEEIRSTGNVFQLEFKVAADAMGYALEIQDTVRERNAGVLPQGWIHTRTAIGEVKRCQFGHRHAHAGAGFVACLHSLAEADGICVSELVVTSVGKRLEGDFVSMGPHTVINGKPSYRFIAVQRERQ